MAAKAPALLNTIHVLSILLTALCLGPALAHLLSLPNKLGLGRDEYFIVQQIYRGWALLGILVVGSVASTGALAWLAAAAPAVRYLALTALLCLLAAQAVFWTLTFPANAATENWTAVPENWQSLRVQWEYSHAVGSLLTLTALVALIFSLLARVRRPV
jgi:hypothetical protein